MQRDSGMKWVKTQVGRGGIKEHFLFGSGLANIMSLLLKYGVTKCCKVQIRSKRHIMESHY